MAIMKVDVAQAILDYEGKPILQSKEVTEDGNTTIQQVPWTYRDAIHTALHYVEPLRGPDGQVQHAKDGTVITKPLTGEEKGKVFRMASKLWGAKPFFKVADDERVFILSQIVAVYGPIVYGRIRELFGEPFDVSNDDPAEAQESKS